jgi:hypothetical protein
MKRFTTYTNSEGNFFVDCQSTITNKYLLCKIQPEHYVDVVEILSKNENEFTNDEKDALTRNVEINSRWVEYKNNSFDGYRETILTKTIPDEIKTLYKYHLAKREDEKNNYIDYLDSPPQGGRKTKRRKSKRRKTSRAKKSKKRVNKKGRKTRK